MPLHNDLRHTGNNLTGLHNAWTSEPWLGHADPGFTVKDGSGYWGEDQKPGSGAGSGEEVRVKSDKLSLTPHRDNVTLSMWRR